MTVSVWRVSCPARVRLRRHRVAALLSDERTTVVLEAPGRIGATLAELAAAEAAAPVAVVRELTKLHEEVWRGSLADAAAAFAAARCAAKSCSCLRAHPRRSRPATTRWTLRYEPRWTGTATGLRQIADRVATALGVPRRRAYEAALRAREAGEPALVGAALRPPVRYRPCPPTT